MAPKKEALAIAEVELKKTMGELRGKQAALKAVEDELGELQRQFEAANRKKADLEQQVRRSRISHSPPPAFVCTLRVMCMCLFKGGGLFLVLTFKLASCCR